MLTDSSFADKVTTSPALEPVSLPQPSSPVVATDDVTSSTIPITPSQQPPPIDVCESPLLDPWILLSEPSPSCPPPSTTTENKSSASVTVPTTTYISAAPPKKTTREEPILIELERAATVIHSKLHTYIGKAKSKVTETLEAKAAMRKRDELLRRRANGGVNVGYGEYNDGSSTKEISNASVDGGDGSGSGPMKMTEETMAEIFPEKDRPTATAPQSLKEIQSKVRKAGVALAGGSMVALGAVMTPAPTPGGILMMGAGMAVLGTEFPKCQKILDTGRDKLVGAIEATGCEKDEDEEEVINEETKVITQEKGKEGEQHEQQQASSTETSENTVFILSSNSVPASTDSSTTSPSPVDEISTDLSSEISSRMQDASLVIKKQAKRFGRNLLPVLRQIGTQSPVVEDDEEEHVATKFPSVVVDDLVEAPLVDNFAIMAESPTEDTCVDDKPH